MEKSYRVECLQNSHERTDLKIGFVGEADNDQRVLDAVASIMELRLSGGKLVSFDGPCSMPVAFALSHAVAHLFGAIAVKDPKLGKFVVSVSHRPDLLVGALID
ncbi:MAG: hypothetical protein ABL921_11515 [Pirellula sp.]